MYESSFRKNLQNWILSFRTQDMIFKTTSTQIGSLSGKFLISGLKSVNTSCSTPATVSGSGCYSVYVVI